MKINIQYVKEGSHSFVFEKNRYDLNLVDSQIFVNDIHIEGHLEKRDKNIYVTTLIDTQVEYTCDKCLSKFVVNLNDTFHVLFTWDQAYAECESDEAVEMIKPNTGEIDLAPSVRESLLLAIPMKVVCSENCKGLCSGCGVDLNEETCRCEQEKIDPRWNELKKLIR